MNGYLILGAAVLLIAVFAAVRILEYRRSFGGPEEETKTCAGQLLSCGMDAGSTLLGKPAYKAEFLLNGGERLTLEVHSMPLYRTLVPGTSGTIVRSGKSLRDFRVKANGTDPEPKKENTVMNNRILLKNGNLWGVGPRDILVENGKILAVGEGLAAEAECIDLGGKTVLPGFFNAHVHLYGVRGPLPDDLIRSFVTGGCTTVRDMGMTSEEPFETYLEWLSTRRGTDFPEVLTSGKFLCGNNTYGMVHPSGKRIGYLIEETPEGAAAAVDAMADLGADQIKTGQDYGMNPNEPLDYLSEEVFRALCRRAKERGLPISAHITKRDNFVNAAHWGLTEGAHTPTNLLTDEDIAEVVRSGMAFNTTGSIFDSVSAMTGEDIMDAVISNIGRLYRAGVPMSIGTDYMHEEPPYETAGIPVHELQLLVKAGLTVEEAVNACTIDTASIIGVGQRLGSVEAGKQADIIAIDLPIDETFEALKPEHVVFVMHRGDIIKQ